MVLTDEGLARGFDDPVTESQSVFRTLLDAMSRPGLIHEVDTSVDLPAGVKDVAIMAACLALAERETPLWCDADLSSPQLESFLRFHCGASFVTELAAASFVLIGNAMEIPTPTQLDLGTDEYPDRSATLFVRVAKLSAERDLTVTGPGVNGEVSLSVSGIRAGFWAERQSIARLFPRGIDIVLAEGARFVALPRTSQVVEQ